MKDNGFLWAVGIVIAILAIIYVPRIPIWAINTLMEEASIDYAIRYTGKSWLAVVCLFSFVTVASFLGRN